MDRLLKTACMLIPMLLLSDFSCCLTKPPAEAWSLNGSTILTFWVLLLIALFALFAICIEIFVKTRKYIIDQVVWDNTI